MAVVERMKPEIAEAAEREMFGVITDLHLYTEAFLWAHGDLLPSGFGQVAMVGVTDQFVEVPVGDPHRATHAVGIDTREVEATGGYIWQLGIAHPAGRFVTTINTSAGLESHVTLDVQGRLRASSLDPKALDLASRRIMQILDLPLVTQNINHLKTKRIEAEGEIERYIQENTGLLAPRLLEKRVASKRSNAEKIGFTALAPVRY